MVVPWLDWRLLHPVAVILMSSQFSCRRSSVLPSSSWREALEIGPLAILQQRDLCHFQQGVRAASRLWSIHGAASISKDCAGGGDQNEWLERRAGWLRSDVVSSDGVMKTLEHSRMIDTLRQENVFGHNPVIGASTDHALDAAAQLPQGRDSMPQDSGGGPETTRRDSGLDGSPKSGLMRVSMRSSGP